MKKKSNSSQKTASPKQIYFVGINGIKVYPVSKLGLWYIEVNNNGKIILFDKIVSNADLNSSIAKTIIWYYNKLKEKK